MPTLAMSSLADRVDRVDEAASRLSLEAAIRAIHAAGDRDQALVSLLRGAASLLERPQLHRVQSATLEGYCAWTDGALDRDGISPKELSLSARSIACRVAETGVAHLGPLLVDDPVGPLLSEDRVLRDAVLVQPIRLQSRTVCLLIGIVSRGSRWGAIADSTAQLAGHTSRALLKMIVRSRWSLAAGAPLTVPGATRHPTEIAIDAELPPFELRVGSTAESPELQRTLSCLSGGRHRAGRTDQPEVPTLVERISALTRSSSGKVVCLSRHHRQRAG